MLDGRNGVEQHLCSPLTQALRVREHPPEHAPCRLTVIEPKHVAQDGAWRRATCRVRAYIRE